MLNQSLNTLYDKEDRKAESAGNAEERLFNAVSNAIKKNPSKESVILEMFQIAQDQISYEMSETETKIKEFKSKVAKRETEIRIKSLEKQVKIYYNCIGSIDKEVA